MEEGLSTVASRIGRPLYPDAITRACTRLDFARVCVMFDVSSKLPRHIIVMIPNEEGGEIPCKIDVEYEWLPPKCTSCMTLGHTTKVCAFTKPSNPAKPPVSVYVPKTVPARSPPMHDQEKMLPTQGVDNQREGREPPCGESRYILLDKALCEGKNPRASSSLKHPLANSPSLNLASSASTSDSKGKCQMEPMLSPVKKIKASSGSLAQPALKPPPVLA
ncbi:UNVERIFIED_CONTAM: hypothetical protein Sindi_3016600, partial [Sesamum indicum]